MAHSCNMIITTYLTEIGRNVMSQVKKLKQYCFYQSDNQEFTQ